MKNNIKKASKDLTFSDLPKNRKELFFDILRNRWSTLLFLGLLVLIFMTPFVFFRYYSLLVITKISLAVSEGSIDQVLGLNQIIGFNNFKNLVYIPLLIIAAIGLSGVMRIIRKLLWGDYMSIKEDFLYGIKENGIHFSIVFMIIGLVNFIVSYFKYLNMRSIPDNTKITIFNNIPLVLFVFVLIPILVIFLFITVVYREKFLKKIKVSIVTYLMNFIYIIGYFLIPISLLAILLINNSFIQLFYPLVYLLIFSPIILITSFLYLSSIFDELVNKNSFPEIYKKGLYINEENITVVEKEQN